MAPDPPFVLTVLLLFSTTTTITLTSSLSPPSTPTATHNNTPPATPSPTPSPSPRTPSRPSSPISTSPLDPKQRAALESLNLPSKDPCSPARNSTTVCDSSTPFRNLISLKLSNCSDDVALSLTALKSLSTLKDLEFINCPISPIRFPTELTSNLRSFTCINSLKKLSSVWLIHLQNLTELTVSNVVVRASGPGIILNRLKSLRSATISHANLTGYLPKHFHPNITHLDLSANQLKGKIPTSLTSLENLIHLDLSSNALQGEIPESIGDLNALQNVSLASNSLSGSIPFTIVSIPRLVHLDLGSNQLNGTIPRFLSDMKSLKYLNLEKNSFHGVLPFNASFLKRLEVFKIGENSNLCYNHSILSSKLKLGIAQCDKHGLPMSPPPAKDDSSDLSSDDDYSDEDDDGEKKQGHHSGPNKVILGVAIGLASIVFLIVFLVLLSKCCK